MEKIKQHSNQYYFMKNIPTEISLKVGEEKVFEVIIEEDCYWNEIFCYDTKFWTMDIPPDNILISMYDLTQDRYYFQDIKARFLSAVRGANAYTSYELFAQLYLKKGTVLLVSVKEDGTAPTDILFAITLFPVTQFNVEPKELYYPRIFQYINPVLLPAQEDSFVVTLEKDGYYSGLFYGAGYNAVGIHFNIVKRSGEHIFPKDVYIFGLGGYASGGFCQSAKLPVEEENTVIIKNNNNVNADYGFIVLFKIPYSGEYYVKND